MLIRDERPEDAAAISAITDAAFAPRQYDAATLARIAEAQRAAGLSDEDIAAAGAGPGEAEIVLGLRRDGALTLSLVAESGEEPIGHIAFSPVTVGAAKCGWFGLGPVSVRPDRQRQGIGGALIREGLARLRAQGALGCVLLGYPPYYARFGFEPDAAMTYRGHPNPALQRLVLNGGAPAGDVVYHRAFDGE